MQTPPARAPQKRRFFTKRDAAILGAIVLLAALGLCFWAFGAPGGQALVTVGVGEAATSTQVSLARNDVLVFDGENAITVHLEVRDGRIRFIDSTCPDHTCEGFGWLQNEGDWALCAPAAVMVRVTRGP